MASGRNGQSFAFNGYLPIDKNDKKQALKNFERLSQDKNQSQLFIETPYRSQMVLEVALETLQPNTLFGVAQDLTGLGEFICSLPVKDWKKAPAKTLEKLPGVFLVYGR
jgi:16S rRNA (cytidine1402-2'-O)-methyltransferase